MGTVASFKFSEVLIYANRGVTPIMLLYHHIHRQIDKDEYKRLRDYGMLTTWGLIMTIITMLVGLFVPVKRYNPSE